MPLHLLKQVSRLMTDVRQGWPRPPNTSAIARGEDLLLAKHHSDLPVLACFAGLENVESLLSSFILFSSMAFRFWAGVGVLF